MYDHATVLQKRLTPRSPVEHSSLNTLELWQQCNDLRQKLQMSIEETEIYRKETSRLEGKTSYYVKELENLRTQIVNHTETERALQHAVTVLKKENLSQVQQIRDLEKKINVFKVSLSHSKPKEDGLTEL